MKTPFKVIHCFTLPNVIKKIELNFISIQATGEFIYPGDGLLSRCIFLVAGSWAYDLGGYINIT